MKKILLPLLLLFAFTASAQIGKKQMFYYLLSQGASQDNGLVYLQNSSSAFWDFMPDNDDLVNSVIDQVTGQGTSGIDLVKLGTDYYPRLDRIQSVYDIKQAARLLASTNYSDVLVTNANSSSLFTSSFRIIFTASFQDFQVANSVIFGVQDAAFNNGIQLLNNSGALAFKYAAGGNTFTSSASAILNDGAVGETLFDIEVDFTANTCKIFINGVDYSFSVTSGSIAGVDPSDFNIGSLKLCIGGHNTNGTIGTTNTTYQYFTRFSISPIMTAQESIDVISWLVSTNESSQALTVDENYALTPLDYDDKAYWFLADDANNYYASGGLIELYDKSGLAQYKVDNGSAGANGPTRDVGQKGRYMMNMKSATGFNLITTTVCPTELFSLNKFTFFLVSGPDMFFRIQDNSGSTTYKDIFIQYFSTRIWAGIGNGSGITYGQSPVLSDAVRLGTALYDGTQTGNANRLKVRVDGTDQSLTFSGTIPATTPAHNANMRLGIGILPGNLSIRSDGNFYEGIMFTRLLTESEYENLEYYYFRPTYGLTIPAP